MEWLDVYVGFANMTTIGEVADKLEQAARELRERYSSDDYRLYAIHEAQPLVRIAKGMKPNGHR
jgi:hypothetical protein